MKKLLLLISFICIFNFTNVYASTKTYDRSLDDLLVPDYVEVNDKNQSNILLTPAVDATEKIYDFADLFSNSEEEELYNKIHNYIKYTNIDMAIVTINYNNKHNKSVYSDDFYDYNEFGIGDDHSGLLFLIDMDSKQIYMTVTGRAISVYTDERYKNILDTAFKYIATGDYYNGSERFIDLALDYTKFDYTEDENYTINSNGELVKNNSSVIIIIVIIVMLIIGGLIFLLRKNKKKTVNNNFVNNYVSLNNVDNDNTLGGQNK